MLPGSVIAAPVSVECDAVTLVGVERRVTYSHRPSPLPAVTLVSVRLMFLPGKSPISTRITGPASLVSVLFVKFANDPPPLSRASALAPAPVVVTVTPVALMMLFGFSILIASAVVPEVLMATLFSTSPWLPDTTLIAKAFVPVVVMVVRKGAPLGFIASWVPPVIMMALAF